MEVYKLYVDDETVAKAAALFFVFCYGKITNVTIQYKVGILEERMGIKICINIVEMLCGL